MANKKPAGKNQQAFVSKIKPETATSYIAAFLVFIPAINASAAAASCDILSKSFSRISKATLP
jgi:hypothetical protein